MKKISKISGYIFLALTVVTGCAAIGGATHHFATFAICALMSALLFSDAQPKKINEF